MVLKDMKNQAFLNDVTALFAHHLMACLSWSASCAEQNGPLSVGIKGWTATMSVATTVAVSAMCLWSAKDWARVDLPGAGHTAQVNPAFSVLP